MNRFGKPLLAALVLALAAPRARAEDGEGTPAILKKAERIQKDVEAIRGLKFRAPVAKGVKTVAELKAYNVESFDKEVNPAEFKKQEKVARAFRLIPKDYDLRAELLALLGDQVAGFYDPDTKKLFCIERTAAVAGLGEDELTMAHELEHALQDQTFDLRKRFWLTEGMEDRALAHKCVVEGEATLVGYTWMFTKKMKQEMPDLSVLNGMERQASKLMPTPKGKKKVPDYIMENLTFPYLDGAEFVQKFQKAYGWEKTGELFSDPPVSTSQILHPKKYRGSREDPYEVRFPSLAKVICADAMELVTDGTHGEYNAHHVLRAAGIPQDEAKTAAKGWRGDRYQGVELKGGEVVIAWLSTWTSEHDAEKFEAVYRRGLDKRKAKAERFTRLERRGTEVLLLEGEIKDAELRAKLWKACWSAEKIMEKREPLASLLEPPPLEDFAGAAEVRPAKPEASPAKPEAKPLAPGMDEPVLGPRFEDREAGIAFRLPSKGWEKQPETIAQLKGFGRGRWVHGETTLRVIDLPMPFDKAELGQQFEALMRQGVRDYKKGREGPRDVAGRSALEIEFEGTIPGGPPGHRAAKVVAVEKDGTTLLFLLDAPADRLAKDVAALERTLATLEVEVSALKDERRAGKPGELTVAVAPGFEEKAEKRPILLRLQDGKGGEIIAQELTGGRPVADEARATEAFLERGLKGYRALGKSDLVRDGRQGVVLEYEATDEAGPKRVRMLLLEDSGKRATLACAAPADKFDSYRSAFERAIATFRLGSAATAGDAPKAAPPPAPTKGARKGKLY